MTFFKEDFFHPTSEQNKTRMKDKEKLLGLTITILGLFLYRQTRVQF
jgi:hypothetical protein